MTDKEKPQDENATFDMYHFWKRRDVIMMVIFILVMLVYILWHLLFHSQVA